jgi:transposase
VGKTKRGKGTKCMVVVDGEGLPLGALTASASPAEVKLLVPALEEAHAPEKIERLIADRGYDSDRHRLTMARRAIDLIVPHRRNRKRPPTQDGRRLRRHRRRWKVERTISWLTGWRRVVTRWDRLITIYEGFLHLACAMIVLARL